jgi:hypothetical protein
MRNHFVAVGVDVSPICRLALRRQDCGNIFSKMIERRRKMIERLLHLTVYVSVLNLVTGKSEIQYSAIKNIVF